MSNEIKEFFDRIAPSWDKSSLEKEEDLNALLSNLPLKPGMKVIDIACGTGVISPLLYKRTKEKVTAIDISDKMIEIAKTKLADNKIEFKVQDFLKSEEKGIYDFAIIFNAYPHFLNPEDVSKKLNQVLKQNGYFAIVHNCSRKDLDECHKSISNISRSLLPISEEQKYFEKDFNIILSIDDDDKIILLGQKKN